MGIRGSRCKQEGERPQKTDIELARYLHADMCHHASPTAATHWSDVPEAVYSAVAMKLSA